MSAFTIYATTKHAGHQGGTESKRESPGGVGARDGARVGNSLGGGGRRAQRDHAALPVVVLQFGRGWQRVAHLLHLVVRRLRLGLLLAERLLEGAAQLQDTKEQKTKCQRSVRHRRNAFLENKKKRGLWWLYVLPIRKSRRAASKQWPLFFCLGGEREAKSMAVS